MSAPRGGALAAHLRLDALNGAAQEAAGGSARATLLGCRGREGTLWSPHGEDEQGPNRREVLGEPGGKSHDSQIPGMNWMRRY